jgi:hypothetical protein
MMVVHQPSSKAFELMDKFIFMHQGCVMYQGSGEQLPNYFEERGYAAPLHYNPSEWIMEVSRSQEKAVLVEAGFFQKASPGATCGVSDDITSETGAVSVDHDDIESKDLTSNRMRGASTIDFLTSSTRRTASIFEVFLPRERVPFGKEILTLLVQDLVDFKRDSAALSLRLSIIMAGSILIAICFANVGENSFEDPTQFAAHLGAIFLLSFTMMIAIQIALIDVGEQHPRFLREYTTDYYGILSYGLSRTATEGIMMFLQALVCLLITFWSLGLTGRFLYWLLASWLFGSVCVALAMLFACAFSNPANARKIAPVLILPQLLLCGFVMSPEASRLAQMGSVGPSMHVLLQANACRGILRLSNLHSRTAKHRSVFQISLERTFQE